MPPLSPEEVRRTIELYGFMAGAYMADDIQSGRITTFESSTPDLGSRLDVRDLRMIQAAEARLSNELREEGISNPDRDPNDREFALAFARKLCYKALAMANAFNERGNYHLERHLNAAVVQFLLGHEFFVPGESDAGLDITTYRKLPIGDFNLLHRCYMGIAESLISEQNFDFEAILAWQRELGVMHLNLHYQIEDAKNWERPYMTGSSADMEKLQMGTIYGLNRSARIFRILNNTGLAHHRLALVELFLKACTNTQFEGTDKNSLIEATRSGMKLLRHPDPWYNPKFNLLCSRLQVSGAWKQLLVNSKEAVGKRHSCSAFIHQGYLYIAGGLIHSARLQSSSDPRDVWRLNLRQHTAWEFVSKYPISKKECPLFLNREMRVHGRRAYLFTGRPRLDFLDLETGIWRSVNTTYQSTLADRRAGIDAEWPWPGHICESASQQIAEDRLLVFGGTNGSTISGSNLFMELDLKTLCWRRLSGYTFPQEKNDLDIPGPRHSAASWVGGNGPKFYLLYGACDRRRRGLGLGNAFGPLSPWTYDDMWSWDIQKETWRRERVTGNPPSPRISMSCVYNAKINKVVVFGGLNYMCPFQLPNTAHAMNFQVYGDTFIWDPPKTGACTSSRPYLAAQPVIHDSRWQQVMTCGFPTYRCGAQLVCDPNTGKTYLYGGYARAETTPSKHRTEEMALQDAKYDATFAKSSTYFFGSNAENVVEERQSYYVFGDVWQLHIDVPGGDFELINQEDEIRTAQPGPWQRCFVCEKVGFWKKCGGTCDGRAFFCSRDCQVKGRVDHKRLHKCSKLSD